MFIILHYILKILVSVKKILKAFLGKKKNSQSLSGIRISFSCLIGTGTGRRSGTGLIIGLEPKATGRLLHYILNFYFLTTEKVKQRVGPSVDKKKKKNKKRLVLLHF